MPCPEKFKESLINFKVKEEIIEEINQGYEELVSSSKKKLRAEYFKRAVDIMEENLKPMQLQEIMEFNSCCLGGKRIKASKTFAKENKNLSLKDKLKKIEEVPNMGRSVINDDGTITVHAVEYWTGDRYECGCSNFNKVKRDYDVSKAYCYCCGGHFKFHYEVMLGVKLRIKEVVSSPLDSKGKNPCVFLMEII